MSTILQKDISKTTEKEGIKTSKKKIKTMKYYGEEIKRSYEVYQLLSKYTDNVQLYIRRLMRDTLYRDKIVNEFQLKDLTNNKAKELKSGTEVSLKQWSDHITEAKKQLTDFYFAANYSIGYLKSIIQEHAPEIESFCNVIISDNFNSLQISI